MGLFDTLLGRSKPVRPNLDALFALPTAAVTLQTAAGLVLSGRAGVCWMPPAGQSAADVQRQISELLDEPDSPLAAGQATAEGAGATPTGGVVAAGHLTQSEDAYGYRWLLLDDSDVEDLVNRVHLVNTLLAENGWGPQLLCSVFGLVPGNDADSSARPLYIVYLFKRGTFYLFAPTGKERRDSELELRVRSLLGSDLPIEQDLSRWFPLWDLPVR